MSQSTHDHMPLKNGRRDLRRNAAGRQRSYSHDSRQPSKSASPTSTPKLVTAVLLALVVAALFAAGALGRPTLHTTNENAHAWVPKFQLPPNAYWIGLAAPPSSARPASQRIL